MDASGTTPSLLWYNLSVSQEPGRSHTVPGTSQILSLLGRKVTYLRERVGAVSHKIYLGLFLIYLQDIHEFLDIAFAQRWKANANLLDTLGHLTTF